MRLERRPGVTNGQGGVTNGRGQALPARMPKAESRDGLAPTEPSVKEAVVKIIFLSGRTVALRPRDMFTLLREPAVLAFIAIALFISFFVNPHADIRELEIVPRLALVLSVGSITVLALVLPAALVGPLWARMWSLPLPSLLLNVVANIVTEAAARVILHLFYGYPPFSTAGFATSVVTNSVMLAVFDLIFALFVLPSTRWFQSVSRQSPADHGTAPDAAPKVQTVRIAGQSFPVRAILSIEAEEHYVRLRFDGRELLLRDRFSAVLDQLREARGLQTHRSFWVNLDHVERIVTDRAGQTELRLTSGDLVPVSRRRRKEIEGLLSAKVLPDTGNRLRSLGEG